MAMRIPAVAITGSSHFKLLGRTEFGERRACPEEIAGGLSNGISGGGKAQLQTRK